LLCLAAAATAQTQGVAGITYGQAKITPAEFNGDLSKVSRAPLSSSEPSPKFYRGRLPGPATTKFFSAPETQSPTALGGGGPFGPMPAASKNFAGMSFNDVCSGFTCGAGWPPDPNGDVGPNHYIEAVNDAVAIYDKNGNLLASFTEDHLWAGAGTPCDGNSQGDPIVAYDWLANRFVLSWFGFGTDIAGNPISPFYQCFAASKTADPVAGGWWLYPVRMDPGTPGAPPVNDFNDYGKLGLWHDCLYYSSNEFNSSGNYDGVAFGSFSRADMYSGAPLTYALGYLPGVSPFPFTLMPANNQGTGASAAQPGTPEYFVSESGVSFNFEVRTFTAGANCGAGGVLSAPTNVSQAAYTFRQGAVVPQPNTTNTLDMIDDRIMQKAQYRRIGATESIWVTHPVGTGGKNGAIAMQWAQLDVSGGVIATTPVQQQIYAPDASLNRFMGSLAVDIQGNMALGYTTSNATAPNFPSIAYSGRLATDPLNTLPQTEVQLIAGSGSQTNHCGGAPCDRWGDYSAMSLDPADSCTFWVINEYYSSQANGTSGNWQTRIGAFKFPSCSTLPPTTTTLLSSLNPSNVGDNVIFTATVNGTGPTGKVNFTDGGNALCSNVSLTGGGNSPTAQCGTAALSAGLHSIVASYSGDANNAASQSTALQQQVNGGGGGSTNVALASAGAVALASSTFSAGYPASAINNGDRAGINLGAGGVWRDATPGTFPDWVEIDFSGAQTIDHVIVYSLQDNSGAPVDPPDTLTFTKNGLTAFDVQTWNGAAWVTQGSVVNNNLVKRSVPFGAISTAKIRVLINGAKGGGGKSGGLAYSYVTEVEAWTPGSPPPPPPGTTLGTNINPAKPGQVVDFTATVTGTSPTGTVAFTSNGSPIAGCGNVALAGAGNTRTADCMTSFPLKGTFNIVASYSGDGGNPPSASSPLAEVIKASK
jgi:hypothetical protein